MRVNHNKRQNRSAWILADRDGYVLYDALEKDNVIYANMVRPSNKFWNEYSA